MNQITQTYTVKQKQDAGQKQASKRQTQKNISFLRQGILVVLLFLFFLTPQAALAEVIDTSFDTDVVSISQLGYHPDSVKEVVMYTEHQDGEFTIRDASSHSILATYSLQRPTNYDGAVVNCQGGLPCLVGDFSDFSTQGTFYVDVNGVTSPSFIIDENVFKDTISLFLEFFNAQLQQGSSYHADMHADYQQPFTVIADGSFIMEADQAARSLIRLGSAYRNNPGLFQLDNYDILAPDKPDLQEYMMIYVEYLESLQGVSEQEGTGPGVVRFDSGMKIHNAFVPGPTDLTQIDVYIPGESPTLLQSTPVVSLCGVDDNTLAWQKCVDDAELYYKCQIDEPCLNMSYNDRMGTVISDVAANGYGVSKGWGYEFGCYFDVNLNEGNFNDGSTNPCQIFYTQTTREYTSMTLLAFLESYPAINDYSAQKGQELLTRSINTYEYIDAHYVPYLEGDTDVAYYAAALFLLYDYTNDTSYLYEAYNLRDLISPVFISDITHGNEFYWEEYVRHKDAIVAVGLSYPVNGDNPEEFFRGKIYNDYKDLGPNSISNTGENVYQFDSNVQFQNSRYMLIEALLAQKTTSIHPFAEPFISEVAQHQLAWLTGKNLVQEGVDFNSSAASMSFIFGIGDFPTQFHSRLLVNSGYADASNGAVIGARGTDYQFLDPATQEYVYFDGSTTILGYTLGAMGNKWHNEPKNDLFVVDRTFNNGMNYIPGWINGPFDTIYDDDVIFNYRDDLNTYQFTETTNEMVSVAIELYSYLDGELNAEPRYAFDGFVLINDTEPINTTPIDPPSTNTTNQTTPETGLITLETIPAVCTGGLITVDEFSGGRFVVCSADDGSLLEIVAWDKPDVGTPEYFEMYKVASVGSGLSICLGETCISDNGFAQSPLYSYLNDQTTPEPIDPPPTNTTNQTTVTYTTLSSIPAVCTGGEITQDLFTGGRDIICEQGSNMLHIQAWDKPDEGTPEYFEMYKVDSVGSGLTICLVETCIADNGFAKSPDYPLVVEIDGGTDDDPVNDSPDDEIDVNSTNDYFDAIQWYGHTGNTDVSPNYFHLEILPASNPTIHVSSDWEVWTADMSELVWKKTGAVDALRYHIHAPDGLFVGSLTGETQLNYGTTYLARVRFQATDNTYSPWSSLYQFTTLTPQTTNYSLQWTAAPGFKVETFATGLDYPVHVAIAPTGMYNHLSDSAQPYLYVTELYGKVKVIHKDGSVSTYADGLLNFDAFGSITGGGQMGVIGLYVDELTGDLYVGTTYVDGDDVKNKIIHFVSSADGTTYLSQETIVDELPSSPSHQIQQITKGPDGKLYVGLGDALVSTNAQADDILAGKIIRMNMDGSNIEVYAKGLRNPFGQDWQPGTNILYSTDNAPDEQDRIVKIEQGENYGWGLSDNFTTWNEKALFYTDVSPVGLKFNPGNSAFPTDLTGRLYVAVAGPVYTPGQTLSKHILEFVLDPVDGYVTSYREFVKYTGNGYGTPIGLAFAPDGLYFTDMYGEAGATGYGSEGRVLRVVQGTPDFENVSGTFRTNIFISLWYPKLRGDETVEYQFTCHPLDGSGNYTFDWDLGDGDKLFGDTYNEDGDGKLIHFYPYTDYEYTVSCTAHDMVTGLARSASMTINPSNFLPS